MEVSTMCFITYNSVTKTGQTSTKLLKLIVLIIMSHFPPPYSLFRTEWRKYGCNYDVKDIVERKAEALASSAAFL